MIKPLEADKHYITEYYLRKAFKVEWLSHGLRLYKRDNSIDCVAPYGIDKWNAREFIERTDNFIRNIKPNEQN